jgi:threonine/homoserine/homoserine lactone efflux protein
MPTRRRKIALTALSLSTFLALGLLLIDPLRTSGDLPSVLLNLAIFLVVGFPFLYAWISTQARISTWWRSRHPVPSPPVLGSIESFSWNGRPARANIRRVVGVLLFLVTLTALSFLVAGLGMGPPPLAVSILGFFFIAFIALFALGTAFMSRSMTFEVDENGVRTDGLGKSSFVLRWEEIARIEFVPLEMMTFLPFLGGEIGSRGPSNRVYAFVNREGKFLAGIPPQTFLSRELGNRLEAAMSTQASRHGIPVVEVRWRDSLHWRKPKLPARRINNSGKAA